MATLTQPVPARDEPRRPNFASADVQLPAVKDYEQVDREIVGTLHPTVAWFMGLGVAVFFLLVGIATWMYQIYSGLGVAGYNPPVMWGVYIITFVFWIGIGHAGTLISAILYLFRAGFRTTIYRCAEAMTVFAVMTAALFPILHLGRPWKFFWLIPYPNWRYIWPQFKSPLVWDVFAILTYFTISSTFLFIGLIPDSFDFAMALTPGWHTTIFPPYFVAGAIFSGMGMVFTIIIPLRKWFGLKHYVTINHLDAAAKLCLFTSLVVGCAYMTEWFVAWFSGNEVEKSFFANRIWGQWWWASAILYTCNMVLPLTLFSQRLRRSPTWLFILSFTVNIGMWFERFVIVVPSLSHEFEPWQWTSYRPTWVDYGILCGSFGWFSMWFMLFIKQLPVIAIAEVKEIVPPKLKSPHQHGIDPSGRHFEYEADTPGEYA